MPAYVQRILCHWQLSKIFKIELFFLNNLAQDALFSEIIKLL